VLFVESQIKSGSEFQAIGPATENARRHFTLGSPKSHFQQYYSYIILIIYVPEIIKIGYFLSELFLLKMKGGLFWNTVYKKRQQNISNWPVVLPLHK